MSSVNLITNPIYCAMKEIDRSMVSTWTSGMTLQSSYSNEELQRQQDLLNNAEFTFKDFLPQCRDPGGFFSTPVFESFRTLIDRANDWLRANRKWKITTCESVEFAAKGEQADSNKMTYLEYNVASYIRGLRLWLTERKNENEKEQQIGYINIIPQRLEKGGVFTSDAFETLDEVIDRLNSSMQSNPLPGRVLTVESQEMKTSSSYQLDPDCSYWIESGRKHFLFVIRIFYEVMAGSPEEIGLKDFVPDIVSTGGVFSLPEYEPFANVVKKASDWCSQQEGIRFCNAQSVEIKVKSENQIEPQKMDYIENSNFVTYFVRILRVAYTKSSGNMHTNEEISMPLTELTCKTFIPVQLSTGFIPDFGSLDDTKERVSAWIKATGARVLSAETAVSRIMTGGEAKQGVESSFTYNKSKKKEYWMYIIRLYLNGAYKEPPEEMLPPVPELKDGCCVVS